jgi:hypothetical protein
MAETWVRSAMLLSTMCGFTTAAVAGPGVPSHCAENRNLVYVNDADGHPMQNTDLQKLVAAVEDGKSIRVSIAFARATGEQSFDLASVAISDDHKVVAGQGHALYQLNDFARLTGDGALVIPAVSTSGQFNNTPKGDNRQKAYICWYAE